MILGRMEGWKQGAFSQVYGSCRFEFNPDKNVCNGREPKIMEFDGTSWDHRQAEVCEHVQCPYTHSLIMLTVSRINDTARLIPVGALSR
jgi:hypothetical protein